MKWIRGVLRTSAEAVVLSPWWILAGTILVTGLLGAQIRLLKFSNDPDIWAPQDHPYVQATKVLEEVFGGRNIFVIGIRPDGEDIYSPTVLEKIKRLQRAIAALPTAIPNNVVSLAARKTKLIVGTPGGMDVNQALGVIPQSQSDLKRLKEAVDKNPIYLGTLVSRDSKFATIIADFRVSKENPSYSALYNEIRQIAMAEQDHETEIYLGGAPVQFAWVEKYSQGGSIYFLIALAVILLILYIVFRNIQGMLLPIATALLSVTWGLGLMSAFGVHMDVLNTTTPILIMAITTGHAIQMLKRYYEEYERLGNEPNASLWPAIARNKKAVVESIIKVGPIMLVAGLIAAITFYSLSLTGIEMVRHFGFFAGTGILSALILEMTFIPALRTVLPPPKAYPGPRGNHASVLDRGLIWAADALIGKRSRLVVLAGVGLCIIALLGVANIKIDNSNKRYLPPDSTPIQDDKILNQNMGGTNTIFFIIEGQHQDAIKDPNVLIAMERLQDYLDHQPHVGKTQSLVDFIKRMNLATHEENANYDKIPNDRALIAQYLFLYSLSGDPEDFNNFVDNDYRRAVIQVFLKSDSTAYAQRLFDATRPMIEQFFPQDVSVRMGGTLPITIAINDTVVLEKVKNVAQMAVVIFLLSSLVLRSFVGGLFVVVPVIAITITNFGLLGWLGIPLDMGTATTASMAIGIAADYEIYLLFRFREEWVKRQNLRAAMAESLRTSGKAIIYVTVAVSGGYAAMLFSDFRFYKELSLAVVTSMCTSAALALFLVRALMVVHKPRFIFEYRDSSSPRRLANECSGPASEEYLNE